MGCLLHFPEGLGQSLQVLLEEIQAFMFTFIQINSIHVQYAFILGKY